MLRSTQIPTCRTRFKILNTHCVRRDVKRFHIYALLVPAVIAVGFQGVKIGCEAIILGATAFRTVNNNNDALRSAWGVHHQRQASRDIERGSTILHALQQQEAEAISKSRTLERQYMSVDRVVDRLNGATARLVLDAAWITYGTLIFTDPSARALMTGLNADHIIAQTRRPGELPSAVTDPIATHSLVYEYLPVSKAELLVVDKFLPISDFCINHPEHSAIGITAVCVGLWYLSWSYLWSNARKRFAGRFLDARQRYAEIKKKYFMSPSGAWAPTLERFSVPAFLLALITSVFLPLPSAIFASTAFMMLRLRRYLATLLVATVSKRTRSWIPKRAIEKS